MCVALLWSSTAPHAALLPATLEQLSQERESGLPCRNTAKCTIIPLALGDLLTSQSFMYERENSETFGKLGKSLFTLITT